MTWKPPAPTIRSSKDVRRLRACTECGHMSTNLLVARLVGERTIPSHYHGYCFVFKFGLDLLLDIPSSEIGKITLDEMRALNVSPNVVLALLDKRIASEKKGTDR